MSLLTPSNYQSISRKVHNCDVVVFLLKQNAVAFTGERITGNALKLIHKLTASWITNPIRMRKPTIEQDHAQGNAISVSILRIVI